VSIFILGILLFIGLILVPMVVSLAQVIDPREHHGYLPVILADSYFGPTYTNTPTVTLSSPTATATIGPSPTFTLTPYLTLTGTITPIPGITVSVADSPAKVDEILTFTITVKNTGTSPMHNNLMSPG
jgi:hypothetical protein